MVDKKDSWYKLLQTTNYQNILLFHTKKEKKGTTQFKSKLFIFLQENNKILLLETKKKYLLFIAQFHWISDVLIGWKITKLMYQIQLNIDFRILLFWLPCQTLKNLESNCFLSFSHRKIPLSSSIPLTKQKIWPFNRKDVVATTIGLSRER